MPGSVAEQIILSRLASGEAAPGEEIGLRVGPADYDSIDVGHTLRLDGLDDLLPAGGNLTVHDADTNQEHHDDRTRPAGSHPNAHSHPNAGPSATASGPAPAGSGPAAHSPIARAGADTTST